MVKWVQSPRQNVKSHFEKKSSNEQGNAHYGPRPAKVAGWPLTKGHSLIRHLGTHQGCSVGWAPGKIAQAPWRTSSLNHHDKGHKHLKKYILLPTWLYVLHKTGFNPSLFSLAGIWWRWVNLHNSNSVQKTSMRIFVFTEVLLTSTHFVSFCKILAQSAICYSNGILLLFDPRKKKAGTRWRPLTLCST